MTNTLQTQIDDLRASHPGCSLVAFADVEAGLVLLSSAAHVARREVLDSLCEKAVGLLTATAPAFDPTPDTAIRATSDGVEIVLRDPTRPSDALCAVLTPDGDLDAYMRAARTVLAQQAAPNEASP